MVGDPDDVLEVSRDGGRTWQSQSIPAPASCSNCRLTYSAPKFQDPNNAVLLVEGRDYKSAQGRIVYATYVTRDGGKSWQNTDFLVRNSEDILNTHLFHSIVADQVVYVSSSIIKDEVQIRRAGSTTSTSSLAGIAQGGIANPQFIDDLNGWLAYGHYPCILVPPDLNSGGVPPPCPGPPPVRMQVDLLATIDGGKTFTVITPHLSPSASQ
jgi:hypothetical protein